MVLTNTENSEPWVFEAKTSRRLINELVEKRSSFDIPACKEINAENGESVVYQRPHPDNFTQYRPDWEKYTGTYKYMMGGWKLHTYANVALALRYPTQFPSKGLA